MPNDSEHVSLRTWMGVFGAMLGAFMAVLNIQIGELFAARYHGRNRRDDR